MQIRQSESIAISYLRIVALISIVSCHVLQAFDNRWAWVLNIGVQVFLFISGYLYGHKVISDWAKFYKGRLIRVYLPFVIVVLFFMFCLNAFSGITMTKVSLFSYILDTQWFVGGGVNGLGHLWFVTAIMLCYLLVPLLQAFRPKAFMCLAILLVYALFEFTVMRYDVSLFMPLFIFSFGYLYAIQGKKSKIFFGTLVIVILFVVLSRISWTHVLIYDSPMNQLFHTFGGIAISIFFIVWLSQMFKERPNYVIRWLDRHSYEIYLIHHPLILGPLSMMFMTQNIILNISMILLLTIMMARLLNKQLKKIEYKL